MKKSRKLVIYELHSKSYVFNPTRVGKKGRFVQKEIKGNNLYNTNTNPNKLGILVKEWLEQSEWSEK